MDALEFLKKLEIPNEKSYIVGGFVRDKILGITSYDVDIATSLDVSKVKNILNVDTKAKLGSISVKEDKYTIDITTFRKEKAYFGHIPKHVKFVKDLKIDAKRRDFTINAIYMDKDGNYIDPFNGIQDLNSKLLRVIGNPRKKLYQDPIRMLRAFRFSAIYSLKIEDKALEYIVSHKKYFKEISKDRIIVEMDRLFESKLGINGLIYMNDLNVLYHIGLSYDKVPKYVEDKDGIWAQLNYKDMNFSNNRKNRINAIRKMIINNNITAEDIYNYGLDVSETAAQILDIDISDIYKKMNIKKDEKLNIDGNEIKKILKTNDGKEIQKIKNDLISNLLNGKLINDHMALESYVLKEWK